MLRSAYTRNSIMPSKDFIFWEVDVQRDFMLPGGNLYVPGAEKLIPNIQRLTNVAKENKVFLISHGCFHIPNDPEFAIFPPHCVKGTPGAELLPEAMADKVARIPNEPTAKIPDNLLNYQQVLLEKQTLDIFQSCHAEALLEKLGSDAEFVVFGVVTEFCVGFAAKGLLQRNRRVALVTDAIETLRREDGDGKIAELKSLGARLTTTDEALNALR